MSNIRPTTRTAIIEAAFKTFGQDASASLNDVAATAGVGRATLHRHFKGRDDLMLELTKIASREIDEAVAAAVKPATSWTESLRLSLAAVIPLADRLWFLMRQPTPPGAEVAALHARQRAETVEAIDQARKEGAFATDAPTAWIAAVYDALIYTGWEAVNAGELTPNQAADLAWRTLTTGLDGKSQ